MKTSIVQFSLMIASQTFILVFLNNDNQKDDFYIKIVNSFFMKIFSKILY